MAHIARLRNFVRSFTRLIDHHADDEEAVFAEGRPMLSHLIGTDDWLPDYFARVHPEQYQQYLLYCDPEERFSVVSFAWGPGQETPVHDHLIWGMVGIMRGVEYCEEYQQEPGSGKLLQKGEHRLLVGDIDLVSPRIGDIHKVSNALCDGNSLSIHVYGGNIGRIKRHLFEFPGNGGKQFISGYSSEVLPNIW